MPGCNGPTYEAWSQPHNACVGTTTQTSCDGESTCYYAFVEVQNKVGWFSGKFFAGSGLKIHEPGALAELGIDPGDWVNKINGVVLSDEATLLSELAPFTEPAPATVYAATHLLGKYQLTLNQ